MNLPTQAEVNARGQPFQVAVPVPDTTVEHYGPYGIYEYTRELYRIPIEFEPFEVIPDPVNHFVCYVYFRMNPVRIQKPVDEDRKILFGDPDDSRRPLGILSDNIVRPK